MIFGVAQVFYLIQQSCRSIKKTENGKKMEKLTWRPAPGPPAGPAQRRASELLAGQAGRQVLDGEHRMGATHLLAASPPPSPG